MSNNNSPFKSGNKYRSHPYKKTLQNSSVNSYKDIKALNNTSRPYLGTCFGCNKEGHSFWNCKSISDQKREEIRSNFPSYIAKYRTERSQNKPLNSSDGITNSQ